MGYYDAAARWWNGEAWVPIPEEVEMDHLATSATNLATATTFNFSDSSVTLGQTINLLATVKQSAAGTNVTTGTVQFQYKNSSGVWTNYETAVSYNSTTGDFRNSVAPQTTRSWRAKYLGGTSGSNTLLASTSTSKTVTVSAATKDYTSTWTATWTEQFDSGGSPISYYTSDTGLQGYYSGTNGNTKSMIGFTGTATSGETSKTIAQALSGATVTKVEVYLYFNHWYYNAGGTAIIGYHTNLNNPGTWTGVNTDVVRSANWPKPGGRWVNLPGGVNGHFLWQWAVPDARGIVVGPGPTTAAEYYGKFNGSGASNYKPKLRISYTR